MGPRSAAPVAPFSLNTSTIRSLRLILGSAIVLTESYITLDNYQSMGCVIHSFPLAYVGARTPAAAIRPTTRWWKGRITLKYTGPVQA